VNGPEGSIAWWPAAIVDQVSEASKSIPEPHFNPARRKFHDPLDYD
jgi:hypothetical protein